MICLKACSVLVEDMTDKIQSAEGGEVVVDSEESPTAPSEKEEAVSEAPPAAKKMRVKLTKLERLKQLKEVWYHCSCFKHVCLLTN